MRKRLFFLSQIFPVLAHACPALTGTYVCSDGVKMNVFQTVENGITVYDIRNYKISADDMEHPYPEDICSHNSTIQARCDEQDRLDVKVNGETPGSICGGPGYAVSEFWFFTNEKNLQIVADESIKKPEGTIPYESYVSCQATEPAQPQPHKNSELDRESNFSQP